MPKSLIIRFGGYSLVSLLSFVLNILLVVFLHEIVGLAERWAYGITLLSLFFINFALMRYGVYRKTLVSGNGVNQMVKCLAVSLSFRLFEWIAFIILTEQFRIYYVIAIVIVNCISVITKFFVYDRLIFKGHLPINDSTIFG